MKPARHALIQSLFEEYIEMYAARDDQLTARFSDDFCGFTGGGDFLVKNKDAWVKITRQDFAQVSARIRIEMLDLSLQDLSDDVVTATAFFHIHLPIADRILSRETARLTLNFRKEGESWMIVYSGISIPFHLVQSGEIYPLKNLEERNTHLENQVAERTRELMEANRKLELLSNTDGLTAAANRRSFDSILVQEWQRAQRSGFPLAMLMLDVDHFKAYNDHYGHMMGDQALIRVSAAIRDSVRSRDVVARFGGEEFMVLLTAVDPQQAQAAAERIRQKVYDLKIPHMFNESVATNVTVSIGIAPLVEQDIDAAVARADKALYEAKSLGRNSTLVSDDLRVNCPSA